MQSVGEWFHNHGFRHRQERSYEGYDYVEPSGLNALLIGGTALLMVGMLVGAVIG